MNDIAVYALLAAGSYADIRPKLIDATGSDLLNNGSASPLPPGWTEIGHADGSGPSAIGNGSDGFSAKVYKGPAGEIVISYGGTEFPGQDRANADLSGTLQDFVNGNVSLALGIHASQELAAMVRYRQPYQWMGN